MTLRSVVVGTDLTPASRLALERAAHLPLAADAEVILAHVLGARATDDRASEVARELEALVATWTGPCAIRAEVLRGKPHVELIRAARLRRADLLMVSRSAGAEIGTTTLRVVRKADLPVLVVRLPAFEPYRHGIVGVALEDAAAEVLELGARVVTPAASLTALHVVVPARGERCLEEEARTGEALDSLLSTVPGEWRASVAHGDAVETVLSESAHRAADLIVIGSHARSGLLHHLLGSVAEGVLRRAATDVLVGRPARFAFALP